MGPGAQAARMPSLADGRRPAPAGLRLLALVWLAGVNLRSVILAVPPVLPDIRTDLHLSFSLTGSLTSIPPLGFAVASIPGALLVNRFGGRRVAGLGLLGLGVGALLRLVPGGAGALFAGTALLALCVAVAQPALVVLIRAWFPAGVQSASAVLSNALSVGALVAGSLTPFLVGPAGWRGTFVIWALPAIVLGVLWFVVSPRSEVHREPSGASFRLALRDPDAWRAAGLFGCQSLIFFTAQSWLPFLLRGSGPGFVALVLFLFLGAGLPVTVLLAVWRRPWATSRVFYAVAGMAAAGACLGWAAGPTGLAWIWAGIAGVALGMIFSGAFALPAVIAPSTAAVGAYTGLMLTAGYAISTAGPAAGGFLVDATGGMRAPFVPLVAAGLAAAILGATLRRRTASLHLSSGAGP